MPSFKRYENDILNGLVSDCINYGLREKEALAYIKSRFGKEISARVYYRRKKNIDSGNYANEWVNYFSKVGFLIAHKNIISTIETLQQNTMQEYLIEQSKPYEIRNKNEVSKLRYEIRDNAKLLQELYLGTPIVAQIRAKIQEAEYLANKASRFALDDKTNNDNNK